MFEAELEIYDDTGDLKPAIRAIEEHRTKLHDAEAVSEAVKRWRKAPEDQELQAALLKAVADSDAHAPPKPLPKTEWTDKPPEPRQWLVRDWLPAGRLASLYGAGGAGKSRLAMQIAAAVMHGGTPVPVRFGNGGKDHRSALEMEASGMAGVREGGQRVLWLSWEDELDEFRRRWEMAHAAEAIPVSNPDPELLTYIDMREVGGSLWAPGGGVGNNHIANRADWTMAGKRFLRTLEGHALAVIDPIAAAFASSENDRALVRAFASAIDRAAEESECAVLLVGHPPKEAEKGGGSGYSGSTDWRNAVRSMMVLETSEETGHCIDGDGKDRKAKAWRLSLDKASYAREGRFVWLARHYGEGSPPQLAWHMTTAGEAARKHNPEKTVTGIGEANSGKGVKSDRAKTKKNPYG